MPRRLQIKNTPGWTKPEGAVFVGFPSRWKNHYTVRSYGEIWRFPHPHESDALFVVGIDKWGNLTGTQFSGFDSRQEALSFCADLYRRSLLAMFDAVDGSINKEFYLDGLAGKDLYCTCPLDAPCHGDVLLEFANP